MPVTGPLSKPKKPLPAKALSGKGGKMRGVDNTPLRAYDPNPTTSTVVPRTTGATETPQPATSTGRPGATAGGSAGGGSVAGGTMPSGYTAGNYNDAFWSNPDALAQDFLATLGINNPEFTNTFAPTVDALQLLTSFLGADQSGELLDAAGQANQMNAYMAQLLTPGGQALDPSSILMALANADPNSAAGMALSNMSPQDVENIAMQLVAAAGGNPFQARGLQGMFEQGARDYNIDYAKGGQGVSSRPYWQSLQEGTYKPYFGGG